MLYRNFIQCLVCFVLFTISSLALGQTEISDSLEVKKLSNSLPVEDIKKILCCEKFADIRNNPLENGDSTWLSMTYPESRVSDENKGYLVIPRYVIHGSLRLYIPVSNGEYRTINLGEGSTVSTNHVGESFPIKLSDYNISYQRPFFLHIDTNYDYSAHSLVTRLLPEIDFDYDRHAVSISYLYLAYAVAVLVMAIYFLLFCYSTKNISYLYYSIMAIAILVVSGRGWLFSSMSYPDLLFFTYTFQSISTVFAYLFFSSFLDIDRHFKKGRSLVNRFISLTICVQFLLVLSTKWMPGFYTTLMFLAIFLASLGFLYFTVVSWVIWRRGFARALYVFLGCIVVYSGVFFWRIIDQIYIFDGEELYSYGVIFGAHFLEIFIIALGLVDNIYRIRDDRDRKAEELISFMRNQNEILEEKVILRTQELQDQSDGQAVFFANLSHEIRTPLTLIMAPLEHLLATSGRSLSAEIVGLLSLSLKNTRSLLKMINGVLDIQKMSSRHFSLDLSENDISEHIVAVSRKYKIAAGLSDIHIDCSITESCYVVYDKPRVEIIFDNLIGNAIKYAGAGSKVRLGIKVLEGVVEVYVEDDGNGIDDHDKDKIFDYYYQTASSQRSSKPGTGIGLAFSRQIALEHKGDLVLKKTLSRGACFCLSLVKEAAHIGDGHLIGGDSKEHEEYIKKEHGVADKVRPIDASLIGTLLIVDDNEDLLIFLEKKLSSSFNVLTALNGKEALSIAISALPDLIITDVMMPLMDGFEFTQAVKSNVETAGIPVIMLTTRSAHKEKLEGLSYGADDYLQKPFDSTELSLKIGNVISTQKQLKARLIESNRVDPQECEEENSSDFEVYAVHVMRSNIRQGMFSSEELAASLNMSRTTLYRKCKRGFDLSPSILLRDIKLEYAMELLRGRKGNVSQISYAAGFESLSHFSKCFKDKFGAAPSSFLAA